MLLTLTEIFPSLDRSTDRECRFPAPLTYTPTHAAERWSDGQTEQLLSSCCPSHPHSKDKYRRRRRASMRSQWEEKREGEAPRRSSARSRVFDMYLENVYTLYVCATPRMSVENETPGVSFPLSEGVRLGTYLSKVMY